MYFYTYSPDPSSHPKCQTIYESFELKFADSHKVCVFVENEELQIQEHLHGIISSDQRQDALRKTLYNLCGYKAPKLYPNLISVSAVKSDVAVMKYLFKNMSEGGKVYKDKVYKLTEKYKKSKESKCKKISRRELYDMLLDMSMKNPEYGPTRADFTANIGRIVRKGYDAFAHHREFASLYEQIRAYYGLEVDSSKIFRDD